MEIHHLRIFISVFRHKSFTKASEELHISQPTISEHIKNLEKELDCRLFDRLGRTIMATREAELLFPRAIKIKEDLEQIQEELAAADEQIKGELIIGASTIPGAYILPALAVKFKQQHPHISFEIRIEDSAKITERVLNHELLCGIVGARLEPRKLHYHPFIEDELILVARDTMAIRTIRGPDELYGLPFLIREQGSGTRKTMEALLARVDIEAGKLQIAATLGSTAAIKEAVKAGLGVSILSRLAVREELAEGKLIEVQLDSLEMKRHFHFISHKKRTLPGHYQAFSQYLLGWANTGDPRQ